METIKKYLPLAKIANNEIVQDALILNAYMLVVVMSVLFLSNIHLF